MKVVLCLLLAVLAKQAEKKAQEQQQLGKKTKSKKRRNPPNGKEMEPLLKRPNTDFVSGTPSPLIFSRPDSVMSGISEMNGVIGEDTVDVVGSTDCSDEASRSGSTPVRQRGGSIGKTSAPLGGRGKMQRKKIGGGGSGSAAASAGALAGALAASNAAFVAYGISPRTISPSPSNSLAGSPASNFQNTHGNSTHSSPRASPTPTALMTSLTPPSAKISKTSHSTQ